MGKEYRTEYLYKNTILNKLLFAKHDYKNNSFNELPIDKSKADFVMINGKGVVYEIKTELDNLDRIETQIQDYYKAFTEVVVVTYETNIKKRYRFCSTECVNYKFDKASSFEKRFVMPTS